MSSLAEALKKRHDQITKHLYLANVRWDRLLAKLEREERNPSDCFADEQVWTFLVASGYAAAKEAGVSLLIEHLTGSREVQPNNPRIWFEFEPFPPRKKEGRTHVDLALGAIARENDTKGGIELDDSDSPWVCFCEMKWYADISLGVTNDVHRNQLARVIESAVYFQRDGRYADRIYVTLVTPKVFRDRTPRSRLYQYKFEEYSRDTRSLLADLRACVLEQRRPCDLAERVQNLSLRWTTYDELFADLPDSGIRPELTAFWARHGNYQGRPPFAKRPEQEDTPLLAFLLEAVLVSLSGVMAPGPLSATIVARGSESPHAGQWWP